MQPDHLKEFIFKLEQWWVLDTFFNFKGFGQGFGHKKKCPKLVQNCPKPVQNYLNCPIAQRWLLEPKQANRFFLCIYICKNFYIGVVELFVVYINEIKVKAGNKQH